MNYATQLRMTVHAYRAAWLLTWNPLFYLAAIRVWNLYCEVTPGAYPVDLPE